MVRRQSHFEDCKRLHFEDCHANSQTGFATDVEADRQHARREVGSATSADRHEADASKEDSLDVNKWQRNSSGTSSGN